MLQGEETVHYDPSLPRLRRKLTVIGDGACGKTSLLMVQSGLKFPEVN
jgi:GTPase SAR1 family protein